MADEIIVRVRAEGVDEFKRKIKDAGGVVEDTGDKVEDTNKKMSSSFGGLGKAIGGAFAVGAIIQFGKAMGKLATDLDATNAKFKTVFGQAGKIVDDFAKKNARALGLTINEFRKASAAIGDLLVPLGFQREEAAKLSSQLVKLSGDLAKWDTQQRSSTEISNILSKAILGEREQLKTLGVSILEADVKQRLFEKGQKDLEGSALAQAKALATVELITEKTADAQASAADDTQTLREQQIELSAAFRQVADDIAERLIPGYSKLLRTLTSFFATQAEFDRIRDVARTGTFQDIQAEKERLDVLIEQLETRKQTEGLSLQERVNLKQFENILQQVNKLEAERDFTADARGRRGGATDEQRDAIAAQKATDEKIKKEKEALDLAEQKKKVEKELARIIKAGLKEINSIAKDEKFEIEVDALVVKDPSQLAENVRSFLEDRGVFDDVLNEDLEEALEGAEDLWGKYFDSIETDNERTWNKITSDTREQLAEQAKIQEAKERLQRESIAATFSILDSFYQRELQALEEKNQKGEISEKEFQEKRTEILNKQARAKRASAIVDTIVNTAIGVTAQLQAGPAGFVLAGLAAALGAVQLAAILAQPIPQFAEGTKDAPKGFAWVGERGPELVQMRGGEKVITAEDSTELMKILGGYGIPVQFDTTYDQLYKPMTAISKLVSDGKDAGIDWNPLLNSNDIGRRSAGKKLDKIYQVLDKMHRGGNHRMTRA